MGQFNYLLVTPRLPTDDLGTPLASADATAQAAGRALGAAFALAGPSRFSRPQRLDDAEAEQAWGVWAARYRDTLLVNLIGDFDPLEAVLDNVPGGFCGLRAFVESHSGAAYARVVGPRWRCVEYWGEGGSAVVDEGRLPFEDPRIGVERRVGPAPEAMSSDVVGDFVEEVVRWATGSDPWAGNPTNDVPSLRGLFGYFIPIIGLPDTPG